MAGSSTDRKVGYAPKGKHVTATKVYTCGLDAAIDVVGGKWKALILWELKDGPVRFADLRRGVSGISEKMLIQSLRELQSRNIVHRHIYHQVPPKVEYALTSLGKSLIAVLMPLADWGEAHLTDLEATVSCDEDETVR